MVALEIVVHVGLPIALHLVSAALKKGHRLEPEVVGLLREFAEAFQQRLGVRVKIHEDQVRPLLCAYTLQGKLGGVEPGLAFEFRGGNKASIQPVGPSVIAAAKYFPRATSFRRRAGAMAA